MRPQDPKLAAHQERELREGVTAVAAEVRRFLSERYPGYWRDLQGRKLRGTDAAGHKVHVHRSGNAKGVLAEIVWESQSGWTEAFVEAYADDYEMQYRCKDAYVEVGSSSVCLEVLDPRAVVYRGGG